MSEYDNHDLTIKSLMGIKILDKPNETFTYINNCYLFMAIGKNKISEKIKYSLK